jgi:signal transduction histidine kinase/ligand-binding sensor domain-containing protein/DNA-binding response OmpR family regulator
MRLLLAVLFLVVGLLRPGPGFSQLSPIRFKQISSEQGLSNNTIEAIFQDSRGFLWFGTRDGLNRFDGYSIQVYRYNAADTTSLSDNYIRCIYEDKTGALWIGTSNGLNRLNTRTGTFTRFKHQAANIQSISHNLITSIYQDKAGSLWISTADGFNLFQPQTGSFKRFYPKKDQKGSVNHLNCLAEDPNGRFWVGTENGLQQFDRKTGKFSSNPNFPSQASHAIRVMQKDKTGKIWLGSTEAGLFLFDPAGGTFTQYRHDERLPSSLGSNLVRSVLVDKKGNLWVGSVNGGLNLFLPQKGAFQQFQNEPSNPSSLSQRTVSALFEDKQGNIWVGTHRGGINLYMPNRPDFGLHRKEAGANSLSYNDVKTFFEDHEGVLWIGTDGGGLNRLDPATGQYRHYRYDPFNPSSLGSDAVLHVTEDSRGNLWVSTWGGGLNLLNRKTGRFTRFVHNPADSRSISSNFVQQVFEDDENRLWVATYYGGLHLFDPATKTFRRVVGDEKNLTHLMGNNFVSICQDARGNLWFGTDDGGLNCLDRQSQSFVNYFVNDEKMPDLRVLFVDSRKRLWAGQAGLYLFNESKKTFSSYTDVAGLSTEFIKGLTEDEGGNFWISTANGLLRFHPDTKKFKRYSTADGLQGLEFEANAYLKTRSGKLLFGGVNGFNAFYPRDIETNRYVPPVYLTDFYVSNQRVRPGDGHGLLTQDISATPEIKLSHTQATFTLEFSALNYITPENNQYAYRLRNLNEDWTDAGNDRRVTYTNLAPSDYVFEVKASNNDGVWNPQPVQLAITIIPPFWQTWWFRGLLGLVLFAAAFIFLYLKRRYEIQRIEEAKREEMHQMQLQFFTNISHEFRTPLSLILGPLEKLQKEDGNNRFRHHYLTMHRNASRLLGLINELMDFRKAEAGVLKLKVMPGSLPLFLEEISEEFRSLAEEKSIRFCIDLPHKLPPLWFDRQVVEKIIINLVSNSFKYTSTGGTITVRASQNREDLAPRFEHELVLENDYKGKEYLYLQVTDNGIGISGDSIKHLFERYYKITESHLGSGVGLAFVKSLTFLHKGNIYVHSERHRGTEITIALPVSPDDYNGDEKWMKSQKEGVVNIESIHYKYESPLPTTSENTKDKKEAPVRPKHILVVDDNDELRQFLKESLAEQFAICEAVDGNSALSMVKEKRPDLIISDVMMPGMNGMEFCRRVKEDPETGHIPVVMLTAKAAVESKLEGMASGADFYFSKPLNLDLLLLTIRNIFKHRQCLKGYFTHERHSEALAATHSAKDKEFMDQLSALLDEHLSNPELDVDTICRQIGMSRTKLYQTVKSITGQSINDFVRTVRLHKAAQIMTEEDVLITDVMYRVGMQTQSYFTKAFKKEFGKTPTQFLHELEK